MKKTLLALLATAALTISGCAAEEKTSLSVFFVPSRDNATLVRGISFLPTVLKAELAELGYEFETVSVYVGTSYEAVGEALDAGTADIGLIPGGTYAVYSEDGNIDVALTATRAGLKKDSEVAKDWNDNLPTLGDSDNQVTYYRSLGIAGISAKGRELADIINGGGEISWDDLQDAKIGIQGPTSSSGTIYPTLKFLELYDHKVTDLPSANVIPLSGYGAAAAALAAGTIDVAFGYADFRRDYADEWISTDAGGYNRTTSIWEETDVVYVTEGIFNDTVSISKITVDEDLKEAIQQAFINLVQDSTPLTGIASTETYFLQVKDIFKVYSHEGYELGDDADYDGEREAQEVIAG